MPIYRTAGVLTGTIEPENVARAQAYLTNDDMTQYLGDNRYPTLQEAVEHIEWTLHSNGFNWHVTTYARRELTEVELKHLGDWVAGQNSDGLGEGFEQQTFAWQDCGNCGGCLDSARGWGGTCDEGSMISFDWDSNEHVFLRVK